MNLERLREERPDIFLSTDERALVAAFEEPPEEVREAFLNAIPSLLRIYAKKRQALAAGDAALWQEVLHEEADLVGGVPRKAI